MLKPNAAPIAPNVDRELVRDRGRTREARDLLAKVYGASVSLLDAPAKVR